MIKKIIICLVTFLFMGWENIEASELTGEEYLNELFPTNKLELKSYEPNSCQEMQEIFYSIYDFDITVDISCLDDNNNKTDKYFGRILIESCNDGAKKELNIIHKTNKNILKEAETLLNQAGSYDDPQIYYLEDLSLINYLKYSTLNDFHDYWIKNPLYVLNYVEEFNQLSQSIKNTDLFEYQYLSSSGNGDPFWQEASLKYMIINDDTRYGLLSTDAYLRNIIYVPENIDDYEKYVQNKIDNYFGTCDIKVKKVGSLTKYEQLIGDKIEIINWLEDDSHFDKTQLADLNYYRITINGNAYDFILFKGSEEQLERPILKLNNKNSNIKISTISGEVPLDTTMNSTKISIVDPLEKIGTDKYIAYNIKLYSSALGNITNITNGNFTVTIPIPEELKSKNLVVYYINDEDIKEKYNVTIKDSNISFNTNHFSTYVLAEDTSSIENIDNPETGDNIYCFIYLGLVSIIFIIVIFINLKKQCALTIKRNK